MGGFDWGDSNFWTNIRVECVNWLAPIGGTIIEVRTALQLQEWLWTLLESNAQHKGPSTCITSLSQCFTNEEATNILQSLLQWGLEQRQYSSSSGFMSARIQGLQIHLLGLSFSHCRRGDLKIILSRRWSWITSTWISQSDKKCCYDHKYNLNLTKLYSFILLSSADGFREFLWFCRIGGHSYPSCELHIPPHQRGIKWCHLLPRSRNVSSHLLSGNSLYYFPHLLSHRWKSRCQLPLSLLMTLPWLPSIGDKISPTSCHLPSALHFGISHLRTMQPHPLLQYWKRYISIPCILIRVSFTDCITLKKQHDYNKVRDVKPSTCGDSRF